MFILREASSLWSIQNSIRPWGEDRNYPGDGLGFGGGLFVETLDLIGEELEMALTPSIMW